MIPAVLQFGLVHISAGDLLRAEVAAGTAAGQEAASYMDSGNLVPNSVVVDMITSRLEQQDVQEHGWLLDGYPRSGEQAEAIEQKGIKPDLFVLISVSTCFSEALPLFKRCVQQLGIMLPSECTTPSLQSLQAQLYILSMLLSSRQQQIWLHIWLPLVCSSAAPHVSSGCSA